MFTCRLSALLVSCLLLMASTGFAQGERDEMMKRVGPWLYPNAKADRSASSININIVYDTVLTTKDEMPKVLSYYLKQMGGDLAKGADKPDDGPHDAHYHGTGEENGVAVLRIWDEDSETPSDQQRGVKIHRLMRITPQHVMTLVISRVAKEKETHIMVTYLKR
jgi:hypothetical protein